VPQNDVGRLNRGNTILSRIELVAKCAALCRLVGGRLVRQFRYDARQCRTPEADLERFPELLLQSVLRRWSGQPASRRCPRSLLLRQQTLPRVAEES